MTRRLLALLALLASPVALLGACGLLGLGLLRAAPPGMATLVAGLALFLPAAGLASMVKDRVLALALALPLVGLVELALVPVYFPGERATALAAGVGTLAAALGQEPAPAATARLDTWLPALPAGRSPIQPASPRPAGPPPRQDKAAPAPLVAVVPDGAGDQVILPYEGEGRSLRIPVEIEGRSGKSADLAMVFDTGATFTTLDRATLRELGISVPKDAPTLRFQTAGGERESQLVLVDRLWVGGLAVDGVTVGVCDDCASDDSAGLLGLNVSRRFKVTVDQERHELVLEPRIGPQDASHDVLPWVELGATATRFPDGRVEVGVRLANHSHRDLDEAEVTVSCGEGWAVPIGPVAAGEEGETTMSLGLGTRCAEGYTVALSRALW